MDIYLVRHGESQANAGLTDELDSHLTEYGRQQAIATGKRFASSGISRIFVSPFRRTLETAAPICAGTGLKASLEPGICEYFSARHAEYLTFRGLSPSEIEAAFPFVEINACSTCADRWWPHAHEDPQAIYARAVRVRDALLSRFAGQDISILIVSHAETVGRLTEAFQRIAPADYPPWSDNCAVTLLRTEGGGSEPATLIYQNDTSHLSSLPAHATR